MTEKKITTESLARMVQNEFVTINGRLANVETELKGLRQELHSEITGLRSEMKAGFEMLNKTLEKGFRIFGGEVAELKETSKDHTERIRVLELKAGTRR